MQGIFLLVSLGIWWFANWWIALGFFLTGILSNYIVNTLRLQRQLEAAIAVINEHAKELSIRRKQLTVQQNYGLIDDSKWYAEMVIFTSRVIEPVTGPLENLKNRKYVVAAIDQVTQNFVSSSIAFHPGMDPVQYEALVADRLRDMGWDTRLTKGSGDQGIDVIAEMREMKVVIQCKLYSNPVGNSAVQEAIAGMQFEDADYAAVVSNSTFTASARQLATTANVFLLHHEQLETLEESIFSTSHWKDRSPDSASETVLITPVPRPAPGVSRVLRDALIIVGFTVVIASVAAIYSRYSSPPGTAPIESAEEGIRSVESYSKPQISTPETPVKHESPSKPLGAEGRRDETAPSAIAPHKPAGMPVGASELDALQTVRQVDTAAADHIDGFCREVAAGNPTNESLCRTREVGAWQRMVPGNEFPSLSPDIIEKCKQPPFPDSFVAKEACAKYALSDGLL